MINEITLAFNHLFKLIDKYVIPQSIISDDRNDFSKIMNSTLVWTYKANKLTTRYTKVQLKKALQDTKEKRENIENKLELIHLNKTIELFEGTIAYYNYAQSH